MPFYDDEEEARRFRIIDNPVTGGFPAHRAPPRSAVTGIGRSGRMVVYVPDEGVEELPVDPPEPVRRGEPRYP